MAIDFKQGGLDAQALLAMFLRRQDQLADQQARMEQHRADQQMMLQESRRKEKIGLAEKGFVDAQPSDPLYPLLTGIAQQSALGETIDKAAIGFAGQAPTPDIPQTAANATGAAQSLHTGLGAITSAFPDPSQAPQRAAQQRKLVSGIQAEQGGIAQGIAQEKRAEQELLRREVRGSLASEIAGTDALSADTTAGLGSIFDTADAQKAVLAARAMAGGVREKRMAAQLASGAVGRGVLGYMDVMNQKFEGTGFQMTVNQASAVKENLLGLDPFAPFDEDGTLIEVDGKTIIPLRDEFTSPKTLDARRGLRDTMSNIDRMEDLMRAGAEAAAEDPSIGLQLRGLMAGETMSGIRRKFGTTHPITAQIDTLRRTMIRDLIRASNDPRPSDFDVRFFAEMLPMMTEIIGADGQINLGGLARLEELRDRARRMQRIPYDSSIPEEGRMTDRKAKAQARLMMSKWGAQPTGDGAAESTSGGPGEFGSISAEESQGLLDAGL